MGRIVVAVDFGTSRTAYATTQEGLEQEDIEIGVPEGAGHVSVHDAKTPTNVLLDPQGRWVVSYGYKAEQDYMAQPDNDGLFFQRSKMSLHRPASDDPFVQAANGKKLRISIVLTRALEHIKKDVISKLNRGKNLCVSSTDITWVLTVPAIWNDWAKAMMRKAAHNAGVISEKQSEHLLFALEPECVCISVQSEEALGVIWEVHQKILILDCGGGTVDITAHEIAAAKPLQLKELIAPDGGDLGATKVDDRFYDFFQELVGLHRFQKLRKSETFLSLARNWEDIKVTFTGRNTENDDDSCSRISVGDVLLELEISRKEWSNLVAQWNSRHPDKQAAVRGKAGLALSFNLMMSFFQEPVQRIVAKLKDVLWQNRNSLRDLSWIVVAGGFARCPILIDRLRENFNSTTAKIAVSQHPDLAIVKGAAAFGARKSIFKSRKARYTYGISSCVQFDPCDSQHRLHESRKYWGSDGQCWLKTFSIHGRIGDDISVGSQGYRGGYSPLTEIQKSITFPVLVTKSKEVFLDDEAGIQELCSCTLSIDRSLPFDARKFEVEFSFSGTETICRVKKFNGHEYVQAKDMHVEFPREVHWLSRDLVCARK